MGFDVETDTEKKNSFLLATLVDNTIEHTYADKRSLLQYFNTRKYLLNTLIICTNTSFDFFASFLSTKSFDIIEKDGIIYSLTFYQNRDKHKGITFHDTIRYIMMSVKSMGKHIGMPKLDHPSTFKSIPRTIEQLSEFIIYCANDSMISYRFFKDIILKWVMDKDIPLKTTMASEALLYWRRHFLDEIIRPHSHEHNLLVFKAYYGGRTECFQRGRYKNVICKDVNSLYPAQMKKELPHPNSVKHVPSMNAYLLDKYEGVCYIKGTMPCMTIPPLPVRIPSEAKLLFPYGHIEGYYTHVELRYAITQGFRITEFGEGLIYTKTHEPFKEYIDTLYEERKRKKAAKDPTEIMEKQAMNSLYGKYGYNYTRKDSIFTDFDIDPDAWLEYDLVEKMDDFFYRAVRNDSEEVPAYAIPIWAAYITAYGRIHLHKLMMQNPSAVLYCDTDSLFFEQENDIWENSAELGELKLEDHYPAKEGVFIRPKFYGIEFTHAIDDKGTTGKVKCKGVRNLKSITQICELWKKGSDGILVDDHFIKIRTAIRSKDTHKWGKLQVNEVITREKSLTFEDTKRDWGRKQFNPYKSQKSVPRKLEQYDYLVQKKAPKS